MKNGLVSFGKKGREEKYADKTFLENLKIALRTIGRLKTSINYAFVQLKSLLKLLLFLYIYIYICTHGARVCSGFGGARYTFVSYKNLFLTAIEAPSEGGHVNTQERT